jgi:hypothetical protein
MKKFYEVIQRTSGQSLGIYEAESKDKAIWAMLDDAGDAGPPDEGLYAVLVEEEEEECAYCGRMTPPDVPADEEGWLAAAKQHRDGCEWIETRAHTR